MGCATCGAVHRIQGDSDEGLYRNVCACEAPARCARKKCKGPVVQARLDPSGELLELTCAPHGNTAYLDDASEPPPAPEPARRRRRTRDEVDADEEARIALLPTSIEKIRAFMARDTYFVRCTGCKLQHKYSTRKVLGPFPDDEDCPGVYRIVCPKCEHGGYKLED